jgi:hypothetical protein
MIPPPTECEILEALTLPAKRCMTARNTINGGLIDEAQSEMMA